METSGVVWGCRAGLGDCGREADRVGSVRVGCMDSLFRLDGATFHTIGNGIGHEGPSL